MIKLRLFSWWADTSAITKRFHSQFIGSYFADDRIQFVTDNTYDYAVVFGYTKESIKTDKDHTIFFFQEPSWSSNWDREAHKKSNRIFCPSKEMYGNFDENISHPAYMFYGGHGDAHFDIDTVLSYNNLTKSKNTSFVVTYRSSSPLTGGNSGNIYRERVMLAERLLHDNTDVDIYGQMWEYYSSPVKPSRLKGGVFSKREAIQDYRFSIGIENSVEENYITEKLYDILFFNSIPVYSGALNISNIELLQDVIINLPTIENTEECANFIKKNLTRELYEEKSKKINETKYHLFNSSDYNIWKKIIKEII